MRTRFAPSPTGPLHLGHAFSALTAWQLAKDLGGDFFLRIEDIDQSRSRPHWEAEIFSDLSWLGMHWPTSVMRQSERSHRYDAVLDELWSNGLLFPCTCNRRDIQSAASAPQEGASLGPDGIVYPGTCRHKLRPKTRPKDVNLRLDIARAAEAVGELSFTEHMHETTVPREIMVNPKELIHTAGDVVLSRRDMATSYHLSVVIDDFDQEITDVVRGSDLFEATEIHVLLQYLIGATSPNYHHHRLIRDDTGKRLAKRDDARALSIYRDAGKSPKDVRQMVGLG